MLPEQNKLHIVLYVQHLLSVCLAFSAELHCLHACGIVCGHIVYSEWLLKRHFGSLNPPPFLIIPILVPFLLLPLLLQSDTNDVFVIHPDLINDRVVVRFALVNKFGRGNFSSFSNFLIVYGGKNEYRMH